METLYMIGLILIFSKILGLLSKRIHLPKVIGAIIAGLILGPSILGIVKSNEVMNALSELGIVVIMFEAGLETDIERLKKNIKAYMVVATGGVIVPLLFGVVTGYLFGYDMVKNIFIGLLLTATSVGITIETLNELGKLNTNVGTTILGAAIADDIIGIILLSIFLSNVGNSDKSTFETIVYIVLFFVLSFVAGIIFKKFFKWLSEREGRKRRIPVFALAFCLLFAYLAELFGVSNITGAYIAGIVISTSGHSHYILEKVETVSYMLLAPIFFSSIGVGAVFTNFGSNMILLTVILTLVAAVTKIIGCLIGAKISGFNLSESFKISIGMIARGEVALIVLAKGKELALVDESLFTASVIMIIVTTLLTPIILSKVYNKTKEINADL